MGNIPTCDSGMDSTASLPTRGTRTSLERSDTHHSSESPVRDSACGDPAIYGNDDHPSDMVVDNYSDAKAAHPLGGYEHGAHAGGAEGTSNRSQNLKVGLRRVRSLHVGWGTISPPLDSIVRANVSLDGYRGDAIDRVKEVLLAKGMTVHSDSFITTEVAIYERQEVIYIHIPSLKSNNRGY